MKTVRIGCLHTADSNIAVFDVAAQVLGPDRPVLDHEVRTDLLLAAERAGGLTSDIADRTRAALLALCEGNDVVVLTCSTLGPAVEGIESPVPILRVDASLAKQAVRGGGKVVALCAVESTVAPTTRIFLEAAHGTEAAVEVRLVPGAWAMFKTGDMTDYLTTIARAADRAYEDGAAVVALAQASMARASVLVKQGPAPLDSPTTGLFAAMAAARIPAVRRVAPSA
jgi:hypothetical protein